MVISSYWLHCSKGCSLETGSWNKDFFPLSDQGFNSSLCSPSEQQPGALCSSRPRSETELSAGLLIADSSLKTLTLLQSPWAHLWQLSWASSAEETLGWTSLKAQAALASEHHR